MSVDTREAIIARIVAICEDIKDIKDVVRNVQTLDDVTLPCIGIFDGDEETEQDDRKPGRGSYVVTMTPHISVAVADKPEDTGTSLNTFRARIMNAILFDEELATLAGTGGGRSLGNVRYAGTIPAVFEGRLIIGRMNLAFRISYALKPVEPVSSV